MTLILIILIAISNAVLLYLICMNRNMILIRRAHFEYLRENHVKLRARVQTLEAWVKAHELQYGDPVAPKPGGV